MSRETNITTNKLFALLKILEHNIMPGRFHFTRTILCCVSFFLRNGKRVDLITVCIEILKLIILKINEESWLHRNIFIRNRTEDICYSDQYPVDGLILEFETHQSIQVKIIIFFTKFCI